MLKQQNVVFFIGAGFSAPFGLPVMSNFINKSRDLYFSDIAKYKEIGKTLSLIDRYSSVKNYMNIDLHNIEDLLSIAYMESIINSRQSLYKAIQEFIVTVIDAYTDETKNGLYKFCEFISNLKVKKGVRLIRPYDQRGDIYELIPDGYRNEKTAFGIISLNYDLLIENALNKINENLGKYYKSQNIPSKLLPYLSTIKTLNGTGIPMSKLHGSIETSIVPPTWNKNINKDIKIDWKLGTKLLEEATHVVFLGYSLPPTDNYIKFLLASSLNNNKRLKSISIITKDSDGETLKRFKSLFSLSPIFHNTDIMNFFEFISENFDLDFDYFDELLMKFMNKDKK